MTDCTKFLYGYLPTPMGHNILLLLFLLPFIGNVSAQTKDKEKAESIRDLPLFEKAVRCTRYFEGWHSEKHHPYYPKENIIQSHLNNISKNEDVVVIINDKTSDNNKQKKLSCPSQSQRRFRKLTVSLPLHVMKISSGFGYRTDPFTGKKKFHNGIDLRADKGTATFSMLTGVIIMVGSDNSRGNYIMIRHGNYVVTYCHLSRILVRQGQMVEPGETVGLVGSTGRSTGPHLHLTLYYGKQVLNPLILLNYIRYILDRRMNVHTGYNQCVCVPSPFSHSLKELFFSQEGASCVPPSGMTSLYADSRASLFCFESARA